MLPKVATHILHSTSRAAVAVQTQSHHTFRNVLHSSPSSGPRAGPSSGGSGSNGPSSGGQKYTGSRYNSGYAARGAVSQANPATSSQDASVADDSEEHHARHVPIHTTPKSRERSGSISTPAPGILKTVQIHAKQAFAHRRLSTTVREANSEPPLPPPKTPTRAPSPIPTDPAAPQTVNPPSISDSPALLAIQAARRSADPALVAQAVRDLIDHVSEPTVRQYNAALEALRETRRAGEPLTLFMQTYNAMLEHSLLPNLRTYFELLTAITDRDQEIHNAIVALEARARRGAASPTDQQRIVNLRAENTFDSALKLFNTINTGSYSSSIPLYIYVALLRCCANHQRRDVAVTLLTAIENRNDIKPVSSVFRHVIRAFGSPIAINDAELVFNDYVDRSAHGEVDWTIAYNDPNGPRRQHLQVWNQMIESYFRAGMPDKAVEILERMLNSSAPAAFGPADVPRPASSTYTVTIAGFIESGDHKKERPRQPYESAVGILRPDIVAWQYMLDGLAFAGRLDDLNSMFLRLKECSKTDGLQVRDTDHDLVYLANVQRIGDLPDQKAVEIGQFLENHIVTEGMDKPRLMRPVWSNYVSRGLFEEAIALVARLGGSFRAAAHPVTGLIREILQHKGVTFEVCRQVVRLADESGVGIGAAPSATILHVYGIERQRGVDFTASLNAREWSWLLDAAVEQEILPAHRPQSYAFQGLVPLLEDMASSGHDLTHIDPILQRRIIKSILVKRGGSGVTELFGQLGSGFVQALDNYPTEKSFKDDNSASSEASFDFSASVSDAEASDLATSVDIEELPQFPPLRFDKELSTSIEEVLLNATKPGNSAVQHAISASDLFRSGVARGVSPGIYNCGKLIQVLGRAGELERMREVYMASQGVLQSLESDKPTQSNAWFSIENSMIIALAHAGDLEGAHVHRVRMLDMGGAPTADAYGALILYVKDTTDDTSNAVALFQEAQVHRVVPNQYLYNNIISKLAKARKADYALELFEQMKTSGFAKPSSITYGAVIGACARVGDVVSAENLFQEMMAASNYRPRIPPFNTMIQVYTTTKPNRERALYYYEMLRTAGITPTAHTYKLLLDAYGRIEPVDIPAMEQVWANLLADKSVHVQGTHFASLIHAYGCVGKDLDKAIAIFDSIPTSSQASPRDALVFEAMINTLVAHRRTDLMPHYVSLMRREGVHMTAYIANFLIKGYADVGDMEQARIIFESLVDPPSGMAAVHNHAPHEPSQMTSVDPMEPVYREPSTWEAMIRAELGCGDREKAQALLQRIQARCYPEAVYNRISGILVDHSMIKP
ncbi:hypothetical protein MIND_00346700 [Mycena indigotica]|uniref:PROP1-like PPR domain-containing protein n=1 Tax=Mycena indigotica TaxID=2126181 RepID=A0A8H6W8K7_9AGAR|nr:uncharacterized protein MIND_00346700 [Mycena indigotica]KAF7309749.1 hypothetical protein MIND_00346700 [Mycena indigotica]